VRRNATKATMSIITESLVPGNACNWQLSKSPVEREFSSLVHLTATQWVALLNISQAVRNVFLFGSTPIISVKFTKILTNSLELNPIWNPDSCTATQEVPSLLRNRKFPYYVHKSPPLVSVLSQINPVHSLQSNFIKIQFNIMQVACIFYVFRSFKRNCPESVEMCNFS
jgi:hypothetical protein